MLLLLALYTTISKTGTITVENSYKYLGKVNALPIDECDGLISRSFHYTSINHIICGIECTQMDECDAYFYTPENGSSTCTLAAVSDRWTPVLQQSGNSMMYMRACVSDVILPLPKDCQYLFDAGVTCNGIYTIYPDSLTPIEVYCDMHTAGGGWTAFQKREDGSVNFNVLWEDYKNGFGNTTNYWLGNKHIAELTAAGNTETYIRLEDWSCQIRFARYNTFKVSGESDKFRLTVDGYSGNVGDSMYYNNGLRFSTKDSDNDAFSGACAVMYHRGGWWFSKCTFTDLNGLYYNHAEVTVQAMHWNAFHHRTALKRSLMMLRRK